jgi:hypothetical protein
MTPFNLCRPSMRRLAAVFAFTCAVFIGTGAAHAGDTLNADESLRLERRETVVREQTFERGDHRFIGGVTYAVMDASTTDVAAVIENVDSLGRVLPRTKRARIVKTTKNGDQLIEIVSGNAIVEAEFTLLVRRRVGQDGSTEVRFWLDPSRPHGIDDAWGFFRYTPFTGVNGEEQVLLTYGVLVDVGPGIVRELFEERVRAALLSVPQHVRRQVAEQKMLGQQGVLRRVF